MAVAVEDLTIRFAEVTGLEDVTLRIPARQLSAIVGPSGSGKTTLLKSLSCQLPAGAGRILIQDVPARLWPEKKWSACVFSSVGPKCQDCAVRLLGDGSVLNVSRCPECPLLRALDLLGLRHLAGRSYLSLSPHDTSRLGLAAAIAPFLGEEVRGKSAHLWLDDPLDGIDPWHAHRLLTWLSATAPQRSSTIVTLVDHGWARSYAHHAVLLRNGRVIAAGRPQTALASAHLSVAFGS